jgi:predicted transglutaminase-like cysteine proteinase
MKLLLAVCFIFAGAFFGMEAQAVSAKMEVANGLTSQPIGHYNLCQSNPSECEVALQQNVAPLDMTRSIRREIIAINKKVNDSIKPKNDFDMWGIDELWSYPTNEGDCEDYVLLKRKMLLEFGIPANNLLITVVRKPDGEGHAVLTVRARTGDFILDNLIDEIRMWSKTPYYFLKRQSVDHAGRWVLILNGKIIPPSELVISKK